MQFGNKRIDVVLLSKNSNSTFLTATIRNENYSLRFILRKDLEIILKDWIKLLSFKYKAEGTQISGSASQFVPMSQGVSGPV